MKTAKELVLYIFFSVANGSSILQGFKKKKTATKMKKTHRKAPKNTKNCPTRTLCLSFLGSLLRPDQRPRLDPRATAMRCGRCGSGRAALGGFGVVYLLDTSISITIVVFLYVLIVSFFFGFLLVCVFFVGFVGGCL